MEVSDDQRNLDFTGDDLRDEGTARVLEPEVEFRELAMVELLSLSDPFTAEDLRARCWAAGIVMPHHPNAWGALFLTAARAGLIRRTGNYRKALHALAHSRLQPEWVVIRPGARAATLGVESRSQT